MPLPRSSEGCLAWATENSAKQANRTGMIVSWVFRYFIIESFHCLVRKSVRVRWLYKTDGCFACYVVEYLQSLPERLARVAVAEDLDFGSNLDPGFSPAEIVAIEID